MDREQRGNNIQHYVPCTTIQFKVVTRAFLVEGTNKLPQIAIILDLISSLNT